MPQRNYVIGPALCLLFGLWTATAHAQFDEKSTVGEDKVQCSLDLMDEVGVHAASLETVPNSQIQFQSSFEIQATAPLEPSALKVFLQKHIQRWLLRSRMIPFEYRLAYEEAVADIPTGQVNYAAPDGAVRLTMRSASEGKHWSLLFEHPDREFEKDRIWRTNIGVTELPSGRLHFSLSVMHFPRYDRLVRADLPKPDFWGAPALLRQLLQDKLLSFWSGIMPVVTTAIRVREGESPLFQAVLEDTARELPVLFISETYEYPTADLLAQRLASDLAGQAIVMYESRPEDSHWTLRTEMYRSLEQKANLIPYRGYLRFFWPRVRFGGLGEHHRHTMIEAVDPMTLASTDVAFLRSNLTRRLYAQTQNAGSKFVNTIWDVSRLQLSQRIQELQQRMNQPSDPAVESPDDLRRRVNDLTELTQLYEEEYGLLTIKLEDTRNQQSENVRKIAEQEAEIENLRARLAHLEANPLSAMKRETEVVHLNPKDWGDIREIEEAEGIVLLIKDLFPNTIVFSNEALREARKLNFNRNDILLQALTGLASDLHQLVFIEKDPQYMQSFKLRRKLELSNENGSTRAQPAIQRERTVTIEGKEYVGWNHLKFGVREPGMLRIYFDFDQVKKRVVITHIATHLRTAGTSRM